MNPYTTGEYDHIAPAPRIRGRLPQDGEYGWLDFEAEPALTGNGEGDPETFFIIIGDWDRGAFSDEVCVIVHRTCGGKYPIDGALANQKRRIAQQLVAMLNEAGGIDWSEVLR